MRGEGEVEGSGVKVHACTYMYCRRTYIYTHFILVMDPSAVESAPSTLRMMQINEGGYYLEEERGQHSTLVVGGDLGPCTAGNINCTLFETSW